MYIDLRSVAIVTKIAPLIFAPDLVVVPLSCSEAIDLLIASASLTIVASRAE